ncbi:MAG: 16S rRNA (cytosine(967)-C(5))-methyltransferase RsmB, partial [Xanthomonadales bacterium]|nr:16S rRNA (cytosine(967)-C(5))-methyltransferase RsmB [Xanthomonadales bacterium]
MKRARQASQQPAAGAAVRAAAAQVIDAVLVDGRSMKGVLSAAQQKLDDQRDRALLEAIVLAVMRRARRYRQLLDRLLDKPLPARTRPLDSLLLAGLAQLDALELAPHAAISTSVDAARQLRQPRLSGLVNAVLRRYLREREALNREADAAAQSHHEHPDWLREQLIADWGEALARDVLVANHRPAPLWLRLRDDASSAVDPRAGYVAVLDLENDAWRIPDRPDHAICLLEGGSPARLPGWADGRITVQDGAAQFAAELLDPQPGDRLLDACAAPGGK